MKEWHCEPVGDEIPSGHATWVENDFWRDSLTTGKQSRYSTLSLEGPAVYWDRQRKSQTATHFYL